jgi:hypothetical protein
MTHYRVTHKTNGKLLLDTKNRKGKYCYINNKNYNIQYDWICIEREKTYEEVYGLVCVPKELNRYVIRFFDSQYCYIEKLD